MERIWLKNYPVGVPHDINPAQYHSLPEMLQAQCKRFEKCVAFRQWGHALTYGEFASKSRDFAAFLQKKLELQPGERLAIMLPNVFQCPIAMYGALQAGLVVVNVNPLYTPRELREQLIDSGATAVVVLTNFAHTLEEVLQDTDVKHVILTALGDLLPSPKRQYLNFAVKYIKRLVPSFHLPGAYTFREALQEGAQLTFEPPSLSLEDVAFLQYTGGTTGTPKGAVLTHGNMVANVLQCVAWVKPVLREGEEVVLVALPLYHIFSLTVCLLSFMHVGGEAVLIANPRDILGLVACLEKTPCSVVVGLDTLFNALLQNPRFNALDFSDLRLTISGGMALRQEVAEKWLAVTDSTILEGYGLTESSPVVTINPTDLTRYNGSIGLPVPNTQVMLRDEAGKSLGVEEAGELWVKGPQVMQGYWKQPEATSEAIVDGWLRTGDMARMDTEGFLYLLERKKDMILVSGFNVYPSEVEEVIAHYPGVLEVGVVGVPDRATGEAVKACVVTASPIEAEAIVAHCRRYLTGYKVPKQIIFMDELPKTPVGKVLRRHLREV